MSLDGLKKLLEFWSKRGMFLPMAYDGDKKGPSVTLLAFYLGIFVATGSVIAVHFREGLMTACSMALLYFGMTFVFYKLRRLDKVKVDLDDKEIELDGDSEEEKEEKSDETKTE
jgi:amino acid permease